MIFKEIDNTRDVGVICHYFCIVIIRCELIIRPAEAGHEGTYGRLSPYQNLILLQLARR